jgi:predicted dehydrogenase
MSHTLLDFPYSTYASSLTSLIHSGRLGRLLNITHLEPVGYYHFAHSYVRGNWKAEATSAPIVLTKSSHDIDIFCKWLWPLVPSKVSSFAGLGHFRKERKPEGAEGVKRCLECPDNIESRCEYSAKKSASSVRLGFTFETDIRQSTSHVSKVATHTGLSAYS